MNAVRAVYGVLKDLIIGDDWRMILGVIALLLVIGGASAAGWPTWWLPPLGAAGLLVLGVTTDPPSRGRPEEPGD